MPDMIGLEEWRRTSPGLGLFTPDEYFYMRIVAPACTRPDWSQERLDNIRKIIRRRSNVSPRQSVRCLTPVRRDPFCVESAPGPAKPNQNGEQPAFAIGTAARREVVSRRCRLMMRRR